MTHEGQVLTEFCKCGHLKNHHQPMPDGSIQCQAQIYSHATNKMMQCGCKIE